MLNPAETVYLQALAPRHLAAEGSTVDAMKHRRLRSCQWLQQNCFWLHSGLHTSVLTASPERSPTLTFPL